MTMRDWHEWVAWRLGILDRHRFWIWAYMHEMMQTVLILPFSHKSWDLGAAASLG